MRIATLSAAAALVASAGACTTDNYGYAPYYGPSHGYVYPQDGTRPYYAPPSRAIDIDIMSNEHRVRRLLEPRPSVNSHLQLLSRRGEPSDVGGRG